MLRIVASVLVLFALPAAAQTAAVYEHADKWTKAIGARAALTEAGFRVTALDADQPLPETDLLVVGSFASEDPGYAAWVERSSALVRRHVAHGGVVLQLTQADQTEAQPPFVPDGLRLRRTDFDQARVHVIDPSHPLLDGLAVACDDGSLQVDLPKHLGRRGSWETLNAQAGFRVLLSADARTEHPVLVEAAFGDGRLLFTSLYLDKLSDPQGLPLGHDGFRATSRRFFANLREYVRSVRAGEAPSVEPTTPYVPPPPPPFEDGSTTIVVLPDTQIYCERYPDTFLAQTRWIRAHKVDRNVAFVLHEGDITNDNSPRQWRNAARALEVLDGVVPYVLVPGNHDYGARGRADSRDTGLNEHFPVERFRELPSFGGTFAPDRLDNSFHLFSAAGREWLVIGLEWGPRDEVVAWANEVAARYPERTAVVVTHAYLFNDDTRYDHAGSDQKWNPHRYATADLAGRVNDGEELWTKLVSRHPNMALVLSGHVLGDGAGRLSSEGAAGEPIHQLLANYQMRAEGGQGYLRLLEILPDGRTLRVKTYSPLLDRHLTNEEHQFELTLAPARE